MKYSSLSWSMVFVMPWCPWAGISCCSLMKFFMGNLFIALGDFCGSRYECSSFDFENSCHLLGVHVKLLLSAEGISPPVFYSLSMVDLYLSAGQCFGPS